MRQPVEHPMRPVTRHDEQARQDFVGALRGHLAARLVPGNRAAYEQRAEPRYVATHGRAPADFHEVRAAMRGDPYYQFWSALQRRSQEMMWESAIEPTERQLAALVARARRFAARARGRGGAGGSLRLDPSLVVPRYHTAVDIHLQPGGYHTDFTADDVAAGALYDIGLGIYLQGAAGAANEAMGDLLLGFMRGRFADFAPRCILDMGCGIGNSTPPWCAAFPRAEVHAIDVAAPLLRYGHARAEALPRIVAECHRLLRPGGLMLHLEIPCGSTPFQHFMCNWEVWNNNETFAVHVTALDLAALAIRAGFDAHTVEAADHAQRRSREQQLYADEVNWKVLLARR